MHEGIQKKIVSVGKWDFGLYRGVHRISARSMLVGIHTVVTRRRLFRDGYVQLTITFQRSRCAWWAS